MDQDAHSFRGQIAAIKTCLATGASHLLLNASVQASFLRLCGAKIGPGSSLSEQSLLPETVEMGKGCFLASKNTLTSLELDQGRLRIPCKTILGDNVFMGNGNHIVESLPSDSFAGLNTWMPKQVEDGTGGGFFGNPAMRFGRPAGQTDMNSIQASRWELLRFFLSTSVLDILVWPCLKALETVLLFLLSIWIIPTITNLGLFVAVVAIFAVGTELFWYLFAVRLCNSIYNDRLPLVNDAISVPVLSWYTAEQITQHFKSPFKLGGTIMWHSCMLRAKGSQVGLRFFSPNEEPFNDAPFARVGDDVTIDYDAEVRQHSFEDLRLKWGPNHIGSGTSLLHGSLLAMCDASDYVVLMPSSVTFKGQHLEADAVYEGAPAEPVAHIESYV